LLKKYLQGLESDRKGEDWSLDHIHEASILGNLNTIASGFAGGGSSASGQKHYVRSVLSLEAQTFPLIPSLCFTPAVLEDVYAHEHDPVVLSVVTMG